MKRLVLSLACVSLLFSPLGAQTKHKHRHKPTPPPLAAEPVPFQVDPMLAPTWTSTAVMTTFAKGPSVELITIENGQPAELLRIKDANGDVLLVVHQDGSLTTGTSYTPDQAAQDFWKAFAANYPFVCNEALKLQQVSPVVTEKDSL